MNVAAKVAPTGPENEDIEKKANPRRKKVKKETYELDYVDEANYYTTRLDTDDRLQYWTYLKEQDKKKKSNRNNDDLLPHEIVVRNEQLELPRRLIPIFIVVVSRAWDYLYIIFFLLFLIIIGTVHDGITIPPVVYDNISRPILVTFLLAMMSVTQIVPICGTLYFMTYHNLRTHFRAQEDFGRWVSFDFLFQMFYAEGLGSIM